HHFDEILFRLGPLTVRYYGILFAGALLAGYLVFRRNWRRAGDDQELVDRAFLILFLGVVIGARLGHCLFYDPERYLGDPVQILKVWEGGLASHGAAIGLVIGVWVAARRLKRPYTQLSDRLSPGIALGSSFVRLGNFVNSEIVGRPSDVPWAVAFPRYDFPKSHGPPWPGEPVPRHPSQLYELAIGVAIWAALSLVGRRWGEDKRPKGLVTFLYIGLYFSMRFGVEYFKEEQPEIGSGGALPFTMGQLLSIPFALAGWGGFAWLLARARVKRKSGES
ncbi:MAG: prolipoprotein diacylglyceryl transferase, partial [Planctomycetes bacterium]|nr:prolipoprotein diacylglyceryl transferase [Planctomycetota bacterium]